MKRALATLLAGILAAGALAKGHLPRLTVKPARGHYSMSKGTTTMRGSKTQGNGGASPPLTFGRPNYGGKRPSAGAGP